MRSSFLIHFLGRNERKRNKKKNALSSSIRAESGKARQIEKHRKIHEEAIAKATASGHKEAIKQLGEFDETKALHNDTKKIGLIGK